MIKLEFEGISNLFKVRVNTENRTFQHALKIFNIVINCQQFSSKREEKEQLPQTINTMLNDVTNAVIQLNGVVYQN